MLRKRQVVRVAPPSMKWSSFMANKGPKSEAASYSFVLRGYVKHWLGKVWAEFDRVKLLDIVLAEPHRKTARQA